MKYSGFLVLVVLLIFSSPVFAKPAAEFENSRGGACSQGYVTAPGDTLAAIARLCTVRLADLQSANSHLPGTGFMPAGVPVRIPVNHPDRAVYSEPEEPALANAVPITGPLKEYSIRSGDNLYTVAKKAGLTLGQLLYANPAIQNPDYIHPGQVIVLPGPGGPSLDKDQWAQLKLDSSLETIQVKDPGYQAGSSTEHWVLVDLGTQTAHAYEGSKIARSFLVSSGVSEFPTITGTFKIYTKMRYDDMRGPGYDLKQVPYVMYFHKGFGLHGTYWHSNFGVPMSHGCVNLRTEDAAWLFGWARVGTVVVVQ